MPANVSKCSNASNDKKKGYATTTRNQKCCRCGQALRNQDGIIEKTLNQQMDQFRKVTE